MANTEEPFFSPAQRKIVGVALSFLSFLLIGALAILVFAVLLRLISFFSGVIWPLAIAGILALILRPAVLFFERRLKLRRAGAIILLYAIALLAVTGMLALVLPVAVAQTIDFVSAVPELANNARDFLKERFPAVQQKIDENTVKEYLDTLVEGLRQVAIVSIPAIKEAGNWVAGMFGKAAALAIIPIYLFYFLGSDRDPTRDLGKQLVFIAEESREDLLFLIREFAAILVAFFRGQLLIGLIMGLLLACGFIAVGLEFGLVLGLAIGLLNIIPYLGTILGLSVVLPIAFFQPEGGWTVLALCIGVFVVVQIVEGYLLTPRIMGKQTGLHPLTVIISIFFWGTALKGLLGMILAIPLTAFFIIAWRLVKQRYFAAAESTTPD